MNRNRILPTLLLCILCSFVARAQDASHRLSVAVIAPSASTSVESKLIIAKQNWKIGKLKTADAILVVVRSALFDPLQANYRFIGDLSKDAENQLNIAGPKYHVYLYSLGDDLECTQLKHISYEAD